MSQIILNGLTTGQLKELLSQVLLEHLNFKSVSSTSGQEGQVKYLTRAEAAELLQISLPTLNEYTKRGIISSYRIGSNVRYKAADLENALQARNYSLTQKGGRCAAQK